MSGPCRRDIAANQGERDDDDGSSVEVCTCSYRTVTVDYGTTGKERVVNPACKVHGGVSSEVR